MKEVRVENATVEQLAQYAAANLGIEVDGRATANTIITRMRAAGFEGDAITVEDARPATSHAVADDPDVAADGRKVRLTIHATEGPSGSDDVALGHNGSVMLVPRGREVEVPAKYLEVLKGAMKGEPVVNERRQLVDVRMVPVYPYSVHGFVD